MSKYRIGQVVRGTVTGIQNYGVFVKLSETDQGLIHISEINHGFVRELADGFYLGQELQVKIIDIDPYTEQLSLSLRALVPLALPHYPARTRITQYVPEETDGFKHLAAAMPTMIAQAKADIKAGKVKDFRQVDYYD